jgi:ribosomal protein S18 acetylase RimI-like enzyme
MAAHQAESRTVRLEELSNVSSDDALAAARELLLEYGRFVIAQPGVARFRFGSLEKEAELLPLSYREQAGGCLVAFVDNAPIGFVAWRGVAPSPQVADDAWELKRLWVRPSGRGLGLGRSLTAAVLDRAVAAKRKAIYLDTVPASMASAYRMYLDMGFTRCDPYNDNPVQGLAYLVKFL